ncbi:cytochrome C, partial [Burkholderia ubonensis subsp. mesacidophila]
GGTQFLADRRGWLRARAKPGSAGWSDADLLCGASDPARSAAPAAGRDPLTTLLLRLDADPVRDVQAGLPH